jgi:ubiquinol-cytochrome c reductase cytochrome c1 subunit
MKRIIAAITLSLFPLVTLGAGGAAPMSANTNLADQTSLQNGARVFVNFCMGCHSLQFMRYSRLADDIGLEHGLVAESLMFTTDKIGDLMTIAMEADDASGWFGVPPPDLSVIARARGVDWLYTYLTTFYADPDPARPFGVNNVTALCQRGASGRRRLRARGEYRARRERLQTHDLGYGREW